MNVNVKEKVEQALDLSVRILSYAKSQGPHGPSLFALVIALEVAKRAVLFEIRSQVRAVSWPEVKRVIDQTLEKLAQETEVLEEIVVAGGKPGDPGGFS
jgi:hypothetical protein